MIYANLPVRVFTPEVEQKVSNQHRPIPSPTHTLESFSDAPALGPHRPPLLSLRPSPKPAAAEISRVFARAPLSEPASAGLGPSCSCSRSPSSSPLHPPPESCWSSEVPPPLPLPLKSTQLLRPPLVTQHNTQHRHQSPIPRLPPPPLISASSTANRALGFPCRSPPPLARPPRRLPLRFPPIPPSPHPDPTSAPPLRSSLRIVRRGPVLAANPARRIARTTRFARAMTARRR